MKNKSIYVLVLLFLCILSIQAISATEHTVNEEVISADNNENNLETINHYDDVSTSKENSKINLEENDDNEQSKSKTDKTTIVNDAPLTFYDLNKTINDNSNSTIYLSNNYTYNGGSDHDLSEGIPINRNLTIYGGGATLDGSSNARFFCVSDLNLSVNFYNINFINGFRPDSGGALYGGNAYNCTFQTNNAKEDGDGGAIYCGNAYNCTFTQNHADKNGGAICGGNAYNCIFSYNNAEESGGAIKKGHAYNCTFTQNTAAELGGAIEEGDGYNCVFTQNGASFGGAMRNGNAYNCTFTDNSADMGGAMYQGEAVLCIFINNDYEQTTIVPATLNALAYTSSYQSGERLKFNLTAKDMVFDGFNTTINIYKDNVLYATVYALSGEGWIVDLAPGEYIAMLSIPSYPDIIPINTTISVSKGNATVLIDPIVDARVGKEITINYTTNSKGTVTIKVNGLEIIGGKFTPTTEGIYNVTIDVAEDANYNAASNQTTFTATDKLASKITASPVTTTYNVGKYLIITLKDQNGNAIKDAVLKVNLGTTKEYTTDKNGQVKINVATLAPKTYTAKISYGGSDNIKPSTGSVKVTIKKATPKIIAKRATFKSKVKTKKYAVIIKDNKNKALKNAKVGLKVNGKTYATKTNSKGQGVFKITNLKKKGRYTAVITVPTNKYYNKITKNTIITVKQ
ncbi:hypothetical protein [Methanobrevibacter sp.]